MTSLAKPKITVITDGPYAGEYGPGFQIGVTKPGTCGHSYKIGECPICWPVEPTVIPKPTSHDDSEEQHPAFAQIGISRVQGHARLYGSDFIHHNFMVLRVHRSVLYRGLSNDRPHEREEYIEVWMSEGQWATLIASPNSGSGVQCTLTRRNGEMISRLPDPKPTTEKFSKELQETLGDALGKLAELRERIVAGKGGKESLAMLDKAVQEIRQNTKFVADQFDEHIEKTVDKAKVEIQAYIGREVSNKGLEALGGKGPLGLTE